MVEQIRQGDIPGVQLRHRRQVPFTPREIWRWLTRPELLARWVADRVTADPSLQGVFELENEWPNSGSVRERLAVVEVGEPNLISFDLQQLEAGWPVPTRVTCELTANSEGTEVSILQQGFAHLPLSDCLTIWEHYRRRWRAALASLEAALQGDQSCGV